MNTHKLLYDFIFKGQFDFNDLKFYGDLSNFILQIYVELFQNLKIYENSTRTTTPNEKLIKNQNGISSYYYAINVKFSAKCDGGQYYDKHLWKIKLVIYLYIYKIVLNAHNVKMKSMQTNIIVSHVNISLQMATASMDNFFLSLVKKLNFISIF